MSIYFYRGHIEEPASGRNVGNFCGTVTASDAVKGFDAAYDKQVQYINSKGGSGYVVIFDKFEKVE
nr:MAG TPA: hypothetical protein [Caudoviricetes sp.]